MAIFAVGQYIDKHICVEELAVFNGHAHYVYQSFNIISIYVPDGGLDYLAHVGAISAGAGITVVGGKSHLIIDHQVDGPPVFVSL